MKESRDAFKMLTGNPTGNRTLGRPSRRWEDKIRIDLEEIGISAGNWLIRLRKGIIGETLCMRHRTSGFHKPWSYLVNVNIRSIG